MFLESEKPSYLSYSPRVFLRLLLSVSDSSCSSYLETRSEFGFELYFNELLAVSSG